MGDQLAWHAAIRQTSAQLLRFFVSTLCGLSIDLGLYYLLLQLDVLAGIANVLSSSAAVVAMYFLVSRFAFQSGGNSSSVVFFFLWYALSIAAFSVLVQVSVDWLQIEPLVSKGLALVPSFAVNFLATRAIFRYADRSGQRSAG